MRRSINHIIIHKYNPSFANANNKTFSSDLIKKEIQENGAEQFISSHGYNSDIGFELLKKSDAAITYELLISLGQALNQNPVKVLYELKNLNHNVAKEIEADFEVFGYYLIG